MSKKGRRFKIKKTVIGVHRNDNSSAPEMKKYELDLLFGQWKEFSSYQETIDTGHGAIFSVFFATFGIASAFGSSMGSLFYWLFPPAIAALFWFAGYRIKLTWVLKDHLKEIEAKMNNLVDEMQGGVADSHREPWFEWYSNKEKIQNYDNNRINKYLWIPISSAVLIVNIAIMIVGIFLMRKCILIRLMYFLMVITCMASEGFVVKELIRRNNRME